MMARRGVLGLVAGGIALLLAGCGDPFPDYRYKMTIYVETPEGEKAFSSVRQVRQRVTSSILDSSGRTLDKSYSGEAVIIDLPSGPTVYALLRAAEGPTTAGGWPWKALSPHMATVPGRDPRFDDLAVERGDSLNKRALEQQAMVKVQGPRELPRTVPNRDPYRGPREHSTWPMFVIFGDPADPRTVRKVSPESIGVERITIEITDEPVTRGIEQRLAWLPNLRGDRFPKKTPDAMGPPFGLQGMDFSKEAHK